MAIIESLPFINVTVRPQTSFHAANEYPDLNDYVLTERYVDNFERTTRNYIESQHHVEYAVHINIEDVPSIDEWIYGNRGIEFVLLIDGQFMGKRFFRSDDFSRIGKWHFAFSGKRYPNENRTAVTTRNFRFETITTVDDNATDREIAHVRNLGKIEVRAYLARQSGQEIREYGALKDQSISHGTSFSEPSERAVRNLDRPQEFSKIVTGGLLANYLFKYRSREVLNSEQIIPRTPSPDPRPQNRAAHSTQSAIPRFEDLNTYQVERLARDRLRQMNDQERQGGSAKRSVRKRGYDDVHDFAEDGGPPNRPYKVVKLRNGCDAIDLTGHN
ncbi:hypothetical protein CMUS01_00859 [Colletotrichum musicola]|uniref:DUF7918 domain-containing protein n=1 Tax=Colletotrichum musicola TaxID=2175873 RepID=A0A8H6NXY1_9PEZI|nr:hypothetical protein CMUS01_00859 [Colletotrichum musicola]